MKRLSIFVLLLSLSSHSFAWGFFAHRRINEIAIFLLPPEMLRFYKPHIDFIIEHSTDPDKRRYAIPEEGSRHYIDIDYYGSYPYDSLPRQWKDAVSRYTEDTLQKYGIIPWWLQTMLFRLTNAFREKDFLKILRYSAEAGHYIADAHVPLHATKNHNGQLTGQRGIHGFWESRIPELLADHEWDFFIGKAEYIRHPLSFIWQRVIESAAAADTVLKTEKELSLRFPADQKFSFEERNGIIIRQYSSSFSRQYNMALKGMVERRMQQSIHAVASFWYTAWINAGQPRLDSLAGTAFNGEELHEFQQLTESWKKGKILGREHD